MMNRRSSIPSLWREMQRFQNEMNRVFDNSLSGTYFRADNSPSMNIFASEDEVLVNTEVPGVEIKDLEISVVGNNLTISGNRDPEVANENTTYHRQERVSGYFSRSIELPYQVDSEKTEASLEDGVLKIVLPRVEADKPRRISVKTA
jgi:HSP20 family protein